MLLKKIEELQLTDIQSLLENNIPEGKTLEYKAELKIDKDGDKKEFLYDISSFANSLGGDIIFGVAEGKEKGLPGSIIGIEGNIDELVRKMENMLRDSITPRILNIKFQSISLLNGMNILIIRIPRSFIQPHQVIFQRVDKFYSRSNAGKYIMDINELRESFLFGDSLTQKIKQFVKERITSIQAQELPVILEALPQIILHIIPINGIVSHNSQLSGEQLENNHLQPFGGGGYNKRYNLDGVVNYNSFPGSQKNESYLQLYRNGIIETVSCTLFRPLNGKKFISADQDSSFEYKLLRAVFDYLTYYKKAVIEPPISLFLTLNGVKGYTIASTTIYDLYGRELIDREVLFLPPITLQTYTDYDNLLQQVRGWIDIIWNSCGFKESFTFDHNPYIKKIIQNLGQ